MSKGCGETCTAGLIGAGAAYPVSSRMDRPTIEKLYRTYGPLVLRRARVILQDDHAAKDAMQEVFIRAIKAGASFRAESSPMTWLYRITTNYCLNLRRDGARRSELLRERAPVPDEAARSSIEDRQTVLALLERVPLEVATVALHYYVDEMGQEEIAAHLQVSRRHVRDRLAAFRAAAADTMKEPELVP